MRLPLLLLVPLTLLVSACDRPEPAAAGPTGPVGRPLTGQILRVDTERGTLLVDHDEIPGYMPRMAMEFDVNSGDLANAREGQHIRAELFEGDDGVFRLEKIWPVDPQADTRIAQAAGRLREDTSIRGRSAYREIGENLPDFALYNQKGEVVGIERFRGRFVLLNFIYTRCPVATMCPAATSLMLRTQDQAREAGRADLEFVSITLDPEYDTPGVLNEFARARGIDTTNFTFLTGPERAIKDLLTQFGVIAQFDGTLIQHPLATILIAPDGRIIHRTDGTRWSPEDFLAKLPPPKPVLPELPTITTP